MKAAAGLTEPGIESYFDYSGGRFKTCILFPNNRDAALGSLGFQTVYHLFNSQEGFSAIPVWLQPGRNIPYPGGEVLALSIAFELDIANFVKTLIDWRIEPLATERKGPLVISGGVLPHINPLPLAPFSDIIMIGDGEILIPRFAEMYRQYHVSGKQALLSRAAYEPGFFVPGYNKIGEVRALVRPRETVLHSIFRSEAGHFRDMFLVEVGRGCPRKCRFCASSHIHGYEFHALAKIMEVIDKYAPAESQIGLVGSALSDYPEIEELTGTLVERGYKLGLSSLRADVISESLIEIMVRGGVKTLTIAPEAGTIRLRRAIGKGISDRLMIKAAGNAAAAGISRIKLYFLIGLPGETEADIQGIASLTESISEFFPRQNMDVSVNAFVPKAGTPFAEADFAGESYLKKTRTKLRKMLKGYNFSRRSASLESAQAVLSQGDETAGLAVLDSVRMGMSLKDALKNRLNPGRGARGVDT
ncbi:MAG: radical SAM protein [FCB group bacterium]|nr:radical SAM protein [FCB group bacterium]